jgi:hypothetical protein
MVWDQRKIEQLKSWIIGQRVKITEERGVDVAWATVVDIDSNYRWFVVEWDESGFIDRESVNDIEVFEADGVIETNELITTEP